MFLQLPTFERGKPLADQITADKMNAICAAIQQCRLLPSHNMLLRVATEGQAYTGLFDVPDVAQYKRPFDIYDVSGDKLKIRGFDLLGNGDNNLVMVAGNWVDVTGTAFDADVTISASSYIYLKDAISDSSGQSVHAITMEIGSSVPTGGDISPGSAEYYTVLWYIPWSSTPSSHIVVENIYDLRGLPTIPALGN